MTESSDIEFETLLNYIKQSRGFDFTGYKRTSLMRRVTARMQTVGIQGYSHYLDYLEVHPDEFNHLFNTLLINVTAFFRDRPAWEYIASEVVPQILSRRLPTETLRVWSAGCASGEEAYTIAMVIAQIIGREAMRDRVKIYATDVDEEALDQARQATYSAQDLADLTSEQIEQFFEQTANNRYTVCKAIRQSVIFGRHDLIQDAPISRIDLLICRNTLMYFNSETQSRILMRFHFALKNDGFLFLGKAEMLLTQTNTFVPMHLKCRVFTKVPRIDSRNRLLALTPPSYTPEEPSYSNPEQLREAAFDGGAFACIVIDANRVLGLVNERARSLFNLTARDLGRPLQDLEISYRPIDLRSCIDRVHSDRRSLNVQDVEWFASQGERFFFDVQFTLLLDSSGGIQGVSIQFIDVTRDKSLREELEHSNQELEIAYEELQSINEELETTNEELQSSNEELETTNEELQSTNEELETMNEELQFTNEELQSVNSALQQSGEDLDRTNAFLESILTSLRAGVVVVNADFRVLVWNHRAEDLWGLRAEEAIGQNFLNLDIGLPIEQLRKPIRACLSNPTDLIPEIVLNAVNRRGRSIQCHVTCNALVNTQKQIEGAILLMEERNSGTSES